jgi:hypothetical protein
MIKKSASALYRVQLRLRVARRKHNDIEDWRPSISRNGYDLSK